MNDEDIRLKEKVVQIINKYKSIVDRIYKVYAENNKLENTISLKEMKSKKEIKEMKKDQIQEWLENKYDKVDGLIKEIETNTSEIEKYFTEVQELCDLLSSRKGNDTELKVLNNN